MFRRISAVIGALVIAGSLSVPALASSHLIQQWTSSPHVGALVFRLGLTAGHRYQIQLSSQGHVKFIAQGAQFITYVSRGKAGTLNKAVDFKGTTPYTYVVRQPANVSPMEWLLGVQVTDRAHRSLTARVIDIGSHG